jgi:TolA-binding protein
MRSFLLIAFVLSGLPGASWSQAESPRAERLNKTNPVKQAADDPQQRRAAVRAALGQAREQKANNPDDAIKARRQLTSQERQVLRQQLRQQRSDALDGQKHADSR